MKRLLFGSLAVGLMAGPALAGSSYTITPMGGTLGPYFESGTNPADLQGYTYNFNPDGGPAGPGPPRNLYDNIPTIFGGTSDLGLFGPFGDIPGTTFFADFVGQEAQWGDDLHKVSFGGPGPPVVTGLWYGYVNINTAVTVKHSIKIYDMGLPASQSHGTVNTVIEKGALLTVITVPGVPGTNYVTVNFPGVLLPASSVWIKFEEELIPDPDSPGDYYGPTFWLTGGSPGIGYTHGGLTYTNKPNQYNLWVPFDYLNFGGTPPYAFANIMVGLNGFHIPGPGVISLLGLGGLVALRRRRAR